jgi:hypothetical protein
MALITPPVLVVFLAFLAAIFLRRHRAESLDEVAIPETYPAPHQGSFSELILVASDFTRLVQTTPSVTALPGINNTAIATIGGLAVLRHEPYRVTEVGMMHLVIIQHSLANTAPYRTSTFVCLIRKSGRR